MGVALMARPSLTDLLRRVDEQVALFQMDYGYLPRAVEADEILRDIWIEDTYHSTTLEGNPLSKKQVALLLKEGEVRGPLTDSLEVQGYGTAARWVYGTAFEYELDHGVPMEVIRQIHQLLMAPEWAVAPPTDGSRPGDLRRHAVIIAGSSVATTPPGAIAGAVQDWIDSSGPKDATCEHELLHVAEMHAWFERIHPFVDGNGRVGRLVLSFMLLQRGYPPAVLVATERRRYLDALSLCDRGSPGSLAELIARAIETSINRFLIPKLAGDARLMPLRALAETTDYSADYLQQLAASGKLRAVREGRLWLSCRNWLDDYKAQRGPRGRRVS